MKCSNIILRRGERAVHWEKNMTRNSPIWNFIMFAYACVHSLIYTLITTTTIITRNNCSIAIFWGTLQIWCVYVCVWASFSMLRTHSNVCVSVIYASPNTTSTSKRWTTDLAELVVIMYYTYDDDERLHSHSQQCPPALMPTICIHTLLYIHTIITTHTHTHGF